MKASFASVMPSCTVLDLKKSVVFYRDLLGLDCVFSNGDPICFAIMRRDSAEIRLCGEVLS
jgi:catechol 2,3-dioxygenase-like lactoylglutathione lyase family enzyme